MNYAEAFVAMYDLLKENYAEAFVAMYDLLKELNWYFQNVKAYCIPYHYKDCLYTAVKCAADGNFIEARNLTKSCIEMRREFGAF